jgi:hypothetical protein
MLELKLENILLGDSLNDTSLCIGSSGEILHSSFLQQSIATNH